MERDRVSDYLAQWRSVRPDLDVTPMGVLGRLARTNELAARATRVYFASHGLQPWEFDVLAALRRSGPPFTLTPGRLAESTMVSAAAITHRLTALETRGLLTRRTNPHDRRNVLVALTDPGRDLVDKVVTGHLDTEQTILNALNNQDQNHLAQILERLLAGNGDVSVNGNQ